MVRLRAIGECVFEVGARRLTPESDVLFALLLYLASNSGRAVARGELVELFWPGSDKVKARHCLRQALYQLKKLGAPIQAPASGVRLATNVVEIDYRLCQNNRDVLATIASTARPLGVLPGYAPEFSQPFARWLENERDQIHAHLQRLLSEAAVRSRATRNHRRTIDFARACLDIDPLNDDATYLLAEALALRDRRSDALAVIAKYCEEGDLTSASTKRLVELKRRLSIRPDSSTVGDQLRRALVGRERIVDELESWIGRLEARRDVVALVGDAGIGKTRLLQEAARIATIRGVRCVEYRSSVIGVERALGGVLDLLPRLLALPGAVGCAPESYAILTSLARGTTGHNTFGSDTTDSAFRFATIRRALLDLLDSILAEGDLIVSLDDAHALDRPTIEILLDATRQCRRFGLILGMRPVGPTLSALEGCGDIRIHRVPPLSASESTRLLLQSSADAELVERSHQIDWALELANGNPFFLVELSTHVSRSPAAESLPESLHAALDMKLAALSPTARLILQACALLGHNATLARLEAMLDLPPHGIAISLAELDSSGLIASRDAWVGCRHELVAEAVIRGVGTPTGSYLHRRCALVLDREITGSPGSSLAWDCAHHWHEASDHSRALELTWLIVDRFIALGLPQAAVDLCTRAECYCRTEEQDAARLLRLSRAHRLLYDWDAVIQTLNRRSALLGGRRSRGHYSDDEIALLEARWYRDYDTSVLRKSLIRAADERAPALHRLRMAVIGLIVADNRQRPDDAHRIFTIVEGIEPVSPRDDIEKCRARTVYHTSFGDVDSAVVAAKHVAEAERLATNSTSLMQALRWLSTPLRLANDVPGAITVLNESFRLASRLELRRQAWEVAVYLQELAVDCEASGLAREWVSVAEDLGRGLSVDGSRAANAAYFLARIAAMDGDLDLSRRLLITASTPPEAQFSLRAQKALVALETYLLLNSDRALPPRNLVTRLRDLHYRMHYCGTNDFDAGVLVSAMVRLGDREEAQKVCRNYIATRRTRLTPHSALRTALEEVA